MKRVGIPLILTFKLDVNSQKTLDTWRETYFPLVRNHLKAHLTIYHQLPGQQLEAIKGALASFAQDEDPPPILFETLMHRGGFVGVALASPALLELKNRIDLLLKDSLRAQDCKSYRPHITVTNLGSPSDAKRCYDSLLPQFTPWTGSSVGLELYHYRSGPWELAADFPFPVR